MSEPLPTWLYFRVTRALLGEIYPEIRVVTVGWNKEKTFFIKYYVDREVNSYDYERINSVANYILSDSSSGDEVKEVVSDVVFYLRSLNDIGKDSMFIYKRREY